MSLKSSASRKPNRDPKELRGPQETPRWPKIAVPSSSWVLLAPPAPPFFQLTIKVKQFRNIASWDHFVESLGLFWAIPGLNLARSSQEEPGGGRRSQEEPGGIMRSQEEPGARRNQEGIRKEPRGARGSQEEPRSQEEPGGARRSQAS